MDLTYVKKLIKLLSESDVEELEIEEEGKKIRLTKARPASAPVALAPPPVAAYSVPQAVPASAPPRPQRRRRLPRLPMRISMKSSRPSSARSIALPHPTPRRLFRSAPPLSPARFSASSRP